MKKIIDDGGPAFPEDGVSTPGMSLRDYFAIHAPPPKDSDIEFQGKLDHQANPHGDSYKPKRRNLQEIIADLRYAFADAMIARRSVTKD